MKNMNLKGKKYGRLTIIEPYYDVNKYNGYKQKKWKCVCECGKIKNHLTHDITSGKVKSCGCYNRDVARERMTGENNHGWNGGRRTKGNRGYIEIRLPNGKYQLEHRYIFEKHYNIKLNKKQNIHHLNGNKKDNRIENLELWDHKQPYGQRVEDKLLYYFQLINDYKDNPLYKDIIKKQLSSLIHSNES